jgi:hypothetical protein
MRAPAPAECEELIWVDSRNPGHVKLTLLTRS